MTRSGPKILPFRKRDTMAEDPVVISGIGLATSLGENRESVWQGIQTGRSGVRRTNSSDPFGGLELPCAMVDWLPPDPNNLKSIQLTRRVAQEALDDAEIDWAAVDRTRFACSIAGQMGDIGYLFEPEASRDSNPQTAWWNQFLPCTANQLIASEHGLLGPRTSHVVACASGLISTSVGMKMLHYDEADMVLCGAADAISEFVLAAFHRLGVIANTPQAETACRPFDRERSGFVMGEGASLLVLEKRSHALKRGAKVYAELTAAQALCQAHHVTDLDGAAETLSELIQRLVRKADWSNSGPDYINAHGTGTLQNDRSELLAIRSALDTLADTTSISSNKAVMGHLINAASSAELAITALAIRDGYAPPTMHLNSPESLGNLDCLPLLGSRRTIDRAMKLSLAFGGHLVGLALESCPLSELCRTAIPLHPKALVREAQLEKPWMQPKRAA